MAKITPEQIRELKDLCDSAEGNDTGGGLFEDVLAWASRLESEPTIVYVPIMSPYGTPPNDPLKPPWRITC